MRALWRAAEVYEATGRSWDASAAYLRAAQTYPQAPNAADARFRAGLVHYLQGAVQTAAATWREVLPEEKQPSRRARLFLWLGKVAQRLQDGEAARLEWQQAVGADPDGFYGLRARDLLTGRRFSGAAPEGAFDPARYAPRGDAGEAEVWLAGWAGERPEGEPGGQWPSILAGREGWQRGLAQWALGDVEAPLALLREAQAAINDQPWALYALARHARDQRLYLVATVAAARVMALAPPDARAQAPRLLRELAYPTYYAELVLPEAQADGLDPLLFYALTRQESRTAAGHSDRLTSTEPRRVGLHSPGVRAGIRKSCAGGAQGCHLCRQTIADAAAGRDVVVVGFGGVRRPAAWAHGDQRPLHP